MTHGPYTYCLSFPSPLCKVPIDGRRCVQIHEKFKVSALKEDQKQKVFLYFYTCKHLLS